MYIPWHTRRGFGSLPVAGEAIFVSVFTRYVYEIPNSIYYSTIQNVFGMGDGRAMAPMATLKATPVAHQRFEIVSVGKHILLEIFRYRFE